MRLGYNITSKMAAYGIISELVCVFTLPLCIDKNSVMSVVGVVALVNACIGILTLILAVLFQNKEDRINTVNKINEIETLLENYEKANIHTCNDLINFIKEHGLERSEVLPIDVEGVKQYLLSKGNEVDN